MSTHYRSREVVEARQVTGENRNKVAEWADPQGNAAWFYDSNGDAEIYVEDTASRHHDVKTTKAGDYIIKRADGSLAVLDEKAFTAQYEPLAQQPTQPERPGA